MDRIRISAISFLNAAPLQYGLRAETLPAWAEVTFRPPSGCAEALRTGAADVGLIPAVEFQRIPGLRALPGMGVTSPGPVRSVLLVAHRPIPELRRVGVTRDSRTSVALLSVLLRRMGAPDCVLEPFDSRDEALATLDGVLTIGDPALEGDFGDCAVHDMASLWRDLTGLPFVFAIWAVRPGVPVENLLPFLERSLEEGLGSFSAIARDFRGRVPLDEEAIVAYLRDNISYRLGEAERAGLERFWSFCREDGLIPSLRPLELAHV